MLRISGFEAAADETKLRLDGKLIGPWVSELRVLCEPILAKGQQIEIDCGGLSSIDIDGIELMQMLQGEGVLLVKCSPFLELQLRLERSRSKKARQKIEGVRGA
jgi:hypothetical protein